ncbi:MAG: 50S ribosomal protein L25/general stress protein Ctc [Rhizobiales bacterium]|nr:50S ribosomal protein L25/general stress protein Ctc [Hyphomicrobiales bacterium]
MADIQELKAETRDRAGKGVAREARRNGLVPGVIYGDKQPPQSITVSRQELEMKLKTGLFLSTLLNVAVGDDKVRVIPKDVQFDPVRDFPIHVDFLRLGKGAKITVEIPVQFTNEEECPGLVRGGVLNVVRFSIEVSCPADAIPEFFEGDLTGLDIGDAIHASAISFPEGVEAIISDRDFTIATIASPTIAETVVDEDEVDGEEGEEGEGEEGAEGEGEE